MNKLQIGKMPQLPFEVSEAINQLRINLSFCGSDVKTIMITSSTPNEGKSFVTMQLWRMIAELGTPAVLIDCDFRKSEMRNKYGMSTSGQLIGGVHYLAGKAELDDVIYETNVPNGYIIPVAKTVTNPAILLERALCADDRALPPAFVGDYAERHEHRRPLRRHRFWCRETPRAHGRSCSAAATFWVSCWTAQK